VRFQQPLHQRSQLRQVGCPKCRAVGTYQTAGALAADLGHHLADEPIEAKPPSAAYHVRRLFRRYRMALIPVGAAFAIIVLIIVASFIRIRGERDAERLARSEAVQQKENAEKAQEDAQQKEETIRRNAVRSDFGLAVAEIDLGREI
jgi:Na+-transporting methylmalonyl-CoA/oxaloacetate decarboxylase gamma subunit